MNMLLGLFLASLLGGTPESLTFDFGKNKISQGWYTILDGVMGGRSSGKVSFNKEALIFDGELSLENNGGFSSLRSPEESRDLSAFSKVRFRVKGDGRTYGFMLEPTTSLRTPYYKLEFDTREGEWLEVELPLEEFSPYFFGRRAGNGMAARVRQRVDRFGVILADKKPGAFRLEIDYIVFE